MKKYIFTTFQTTQAVMEAKDALDEERVKCELISKPVGLGAGCGIALKYESCDSGKVMDLLKEKTAGAMNTYPFPYPEGETYGNVTKRIYLDHNATTPVDPRVLEAMLPFYRDTYGNPSSIHSFGRDAKVAMEEARLTVANIIGATSGEIVFTSGGTESNNLAIKGVAKALRDKGKHIITSSIEHHAVLNVCQDLEREGFSITYIPVDRFGMVDPEDVKKAIRKDTILITVMHANNEVGTIEPVSDIGRIARERMVIFHTDAAQSIGKIQVNVDRMNVDLLSLSSHKFYGPKGAGALYVRKGVKIAPIVLGGEHERRLRAGTENAPGIVGLGKAIEVAVSEMKETSELSAALRNRLEDGIRRSISKVQINGHPEKRLPNTSSISFESIDSESAILYLDSQGIALSTGSACSSGSIEPSHVLTAMDVSGSLAKGTLRFSLGRGNTEKEIDKTVAELVKVVSKLRKL
ncbi:MAG: cysteine desulfurase NifS [Candidatus Omnitrophota bacterium]